MKKQLVVPFELKEFSEEDGIFTFKGYASTFGNIDLGGDRVARGAFAETIRLQKNLPVLWQHRHDDPIGIFTELREDGKGLFVQGQLPKDDTFVSGRVIPQMKIGSINKMSIGYSVEDFSYDGDVRDLNKLHLWEISLVTIPMNPEAAVTDMKSVVPFQDLPMADRDLAWDSTAAIARVRAATDSDDEPSSMYRRAFLWYDNENAENFGAYKLPIADVVDGRLVAVPRAIFAAAAVLRGARGGVDIPDADRTGVIRHVERYYRKMDLESPFQESAGFRIDDLKSLTERDIEKLLKRGVSMNTTTAKMVVNAIKSELGRDGSGEGDREGEKWADILDKVKSITEGD